MLICWLLVARAQDPVPVPIEAEPQALTFNADRVLITTFQAQDQASEQDAIRLFQLLGSRFSLTNDVVGMAAVPRFEPQGYDGIQYMQGCPPGQYSGCALILGQRVEADRVVGATVRRDPDEYDPKATVVVLTLHIVDVAESREIASFSVPVPAAREQQTVDGVASVFDDVVRGDYELEDMREQGVAPDEVALAEAREERMGGLLAALESELGAAIRSVEVGRLDPPKVTRDDLVAYADREELPPWERVGMSQEEYLRFANSGQDLVTWRSRGWGRFGRILARVSAGGANGPWHQGYTEVAILDDNTLEVAQTVQVLEVVNAASGQFELEVGFGIAPFADLMFATAVRTGQTRYSTGSYRLSEPVPRVSELTYPMTTWQFGGRLQLAPFPRWPARPTVGVGLARWAGAGIPASDRFGRLDAPTGTFLELIPGVEVDATPAVALSLRLHESIPIGGTFVRETATGADLLADPPGPTANRGPGIGVQAGLLVRIGPVFERPEVRRPEFEDEDL